MIDGNARAGLDSWAFSGNSIDSNQLSFDGGVTDHVYEIYGYLGNATQRRAGDTRRISTSSYADQRRREHGELAARAQCGGSRGARPRGRRHHARLRLRDQRRDAFADLGRRRDQREPRDARSRLLRLLRSRPGGKLRQRPGDRRRGGFRVVDGATGFDLAIGSSAAADHYQVAAYPNVQVALDAMQTTGAANLPDTGAPFGPGDFTGALQFDFSVAAGRLAGPRDHADPRARHGDPARSRPARPRLRGTQAGVGAATRSSGIT